MNVIVIPDAAMIVIPLIEKYGHDYLSPSNFSRYDNLDICEGNFNFKNLITRYSSSEIPSGVKGRLYLFAKVVEDADAAIVIGKRPDNYKRIYSPLNDLILFGGNACNNAHSLSLKIVEDMDIPILKLAYPTNRDEIISLIDKTNDFLKNLSEINTVVNKDDLTIDLAVKKDKYSLDNFKRILDKLI